MDEVYQCVKCQAHTSREYLEDHECLCKSCFVEISDLNNEQEQTMEKWTN